MGDSYKTREGNSEVLYTTQSIHDTNINGASIQGLTHRLNIFNHLMHFGDTFCLKKVISPSLSRSHIIKGF